MDTVNNIADAFYTVTVMSDEEYAEAVDDRLQSTSEYIKRDKVSKDLIDAPVLTDEEFNKLIDSMEYSDKIIEELLGNETTDVEIKKVIRKIKWDDNDPDILALTTPDFDRL